MTGTRIFLGILSVAVLATPAQAAQAAPSCEQWNTEEFFQTATVEDVTACLAAGADVTLDGFGREPLHWAAGNNENPAVIEALVAAGADVSARDEQGATHLHAAAEAQKISTYVVSPVLGKQQEKEQNRAPVYDPPKPSKPERLTPAVEVAREPERVPRSAACG